MYNKIVYVVDDIGDNRDLIASLMKTVEIPTVLLSTAQEFLDNYKPSIPACLLLDICMPGMSGIELQHLLVDQGIQIPIIFVTAHSNINIAVKAMKMGAFSFIEKPIDAQQVISLVFDAISECRRIADKQSELHTIQNLVDNLTNREREVMKMVVAGEPNKRIAYTLAISERTVEVHRSRVMKKMMSPSLTSLVEKALKVNL